ncbi:unnamed protein product [Eruca vesicaria subsp. sativa]|uniref:Uncharacterized protein n=1 Tax=Eruca vesicaria subsp. sativa TaxID=29727 RepID=A0ABC8KAG0_ERUVS|nr:unnamed protein product [Eruca vesicaria subsp. sativa]
MSLKEVRGALLQYTSCADPSESAARRERLRQAEAQGTLDETAAQVVRSSFPVSESERPLSPLPNSGTTRTPIARRLGAQPDKAIASSSRVPIMERLGPLVDEAISEERINLETAPPPQKRKPGRPPGRKTVNASPLKLGGAGLRRRKVLSNKPPPPWKEKQFSSYG